jgi:glycosyltransferase involved in cell wall biosynthesis
MNESGGLKVAILGTRGIPARYGGFETFAEQLGIRLAARGHDVTVYARRAFGAAYAGPASFQGVKIEAAPTIMHKYLETPLHALTSFLHLRRRKCDVVLLCNAANSPFAWIARLRGLPLVINVDGIERRRSKWNMLGRAWYRLGEWCSVRFADCLVADAKVIARYYEKTYGCQAEIIAYGAQPRPREPGATLAEFSLQKDNYILYVSRLEPENNALGVIQAYARLNTTLPLVIVGDAPYAKEYIAALKKSAGARVIFTGYQFGESYWELCSNCLLYVQATEVGGTHPALVENMACGNCIVANATPEHFETLGGAGVYYWRNDFQNLSERLGALLSDREAVQSYRALARARAGRLYDWEKICGQYEEAFRRMAAKPGY